MKTRKWLTPGNILFGMYLVFVSCVLNCNGDAPVLRHENPIPQALPEVAAVVVPAAPVLAKPLVVVPYKPAPHLVPKPPAHAKVIQIALAPKKEPTPAPTRAYKPGSVISEDCETKGMCPMPMKATASQAGSGALTLNLPDCPALTGDIVQITVGGVPATAIGSFDIGVAPNDGVTLIKCQTLPGNVLTVIFQATAAGSYVLFADAPDGANGILRAKQILVVAAKNPPPPPIPTPPPGPPPGPTPDPKPPAPPVPTKLRVLVLYDPTKLTPSIPPQPTDLTEEQRQVIFSAAPGSLRAYMASHCLIDTVKDSAGGTDSLPAWKMWPVNVDATQVGSLWTPLLTKAGGKAGIIVQAGDNITNYDFPADNDSAVKLLTPLGGN
jgi:hypothetical protein